MGAVIVLGSANLDLVVEVARLPRAGETVGDGRFRTEPGGKGLNQAVAAARSGATTTFVGCIGRDPAGQQLLEALTDEGIDTRNLVLTDDATGTAVILIDAAGENMIAVAPGANARVAGADVPSGDVLLCQLEVPVTAIVAAAEVAMVAGRRVVLNLAPAPADPTALIGFADLVIANASEAAALTGATDGEAAALALMSLFGASAIVTMGASGSVLAHGGRAEVFAAPEVTVIDTVGAGDAFCGVLAAALADGLDVPAGIRYASAAGALTATRRGAAAAMPSRAEVEALVRSDAW